LKNLDKHIAVGRHKIPKEPVTFRDAAITSYVDKVEKMPLVAFTKEMLQEIAEAPSETGEDYTPLPTGWALRKHKPPTRKSPAVIEWLTAKYDAGELRRNRKTDPKALEEEMFRAANADGTPKFGPEDFLDAGQIRQFFSKITAERRKKKLQKRQPTPRDIDIEVDEEMDFDRSEDVDLETITTSAYLQEITTGSVSRRLRHRRHHKHHRHRHHRHF